MSESIRHGMRGSFCPRKHSSGPPAVAPQDRTMHGGPGVGAISKTDIVDAIVKL